MMKTKNVLVSGIMLMALLMAAAPTAAAHEERCNLLDVLCQAFCYLGHASTPFPHGCIWVRESVIEVLLRVALAPLSLLG